MFPEGRLLDFVIVGAVALIVVGPKDLPMLMRKVGQFMARVRGMAAEFRACFDELARQSELDELRREVEALRTARPLDFAAHGHGRAGRGLRHQGRPRRRRNAAHDRADAGAAEAAPPQPPPPAGRRPNAAAEPAPKSPAETRARRRRRRDRRRQTKPRSRRPARR